MNIFIVYCHPEPKSLNGTLKDLAVKTLKENGHQIKISDLYGMKFKATLDRDDFLQMENPERLMPVIEQFNASKTNSFARDIKEEMEKIGWADLIIFQFPIWYETMPALLKAWFERVLAHGFAHNMLEGKIIQHGFLKGKKAMLSFTAGSAKETFYNVIEGEDKSNLLPPISKALRFTGLEMIDAFAVFDAMPLSEEYAKKSFDEYKKLLSEL
ncbi:MAG: NAD(P)H-dependent oxidoreductase [Methanobacterium sp.]